MLPFQAKTVAEPSAAISTAASTAETVFSFVNPPTPYPRLGLVTLEVPHRFRSIRDDTPVPDCCEDTHVGAGSGWRLPKDLKLAPRRA